MFPREMLRIDFSISARARVCGESSLPHELLCGTTISSSSEDRWNLFRDATEILTLCTLSNILVPVLQHPTAKHPLSAVLLKTV